ncbi:hypothetical protein SprV_1002803000 [Sparganum proliferum]
MLRHFSCVSNVSSVPTDIPNTNRTCWTPSDQWSEAGMHAGAYPIQSHLLCNADGRIPRRRPPPPPGIRIVYRADDCVLNTTSEEDMQRSMDIFSAACENFGLVINTQKMVVMHQLPPLSTATAPPPPPPPRPPPPPPPPAQIGVNGTQLHLVENFPHLDSTLTRCTNIEDEVARQIFKARKAFGRLKSTVWNRHGLHLSTKLKMY